MLLQDKASALQEEAQELISVHSEKIETSTS